MVATVVLLSVVLCREPSIAARARKIPSLDVTSLHVSHHVIGLFGLRVTLKANAHGSNRIYNKEVIVSLWKPSGAKKEKQFNHSW